MCPINFVFMLCKVKKQAFSGYYSAEYRGHSWSLVVIRGHSWSFVDTRGHSCVLLDKISIYLQPCSVWIILKLIQGF
jgi:hypothetical protein